VDNVQVTDLRISQTYAFTEEFKPKDENDKRPPKPATVTERISLTLSANDSSPNGEGATRFQDSLSAAPYFKRILGKPDGFRLTSVGTPHVDAGQTLTPFTMEAHLPEKTR
jgi:hypothetical protein